MQSDNLPATLGYDYVRGLGIASIILKLTNLRQKQVNYRQNSN